MYSEKALRRHQNADIATKTKLTFEEHACQGGMCSVCTMDGQCEIGQKARTGRTVFPEPFGVSQFGGEKRLPNIEDIQILPELYGDSIVFKNVSTEMKIGSFKFSVPISVAAMGSTKVAHLRGAALAEGAAKAGIGVVIGENVLATYGDAGLKERIQPFLDNYKKYGAMIVQGNGEDIKQGVFEKGAALGAHAIEVKIGQGAKQGLGGEIKFEGDDLAEKYKKLGYIVIKNKDGTYQRHVQPGSLSDEQLKKSIMKYSKLDLPIWVKTGMGTGILKLISTLQELKKENGIKIECLTIDGFGGGTGMSPWLIMNEMSVPSATIFSMLGKKPAFDILLAGGYNNGLDIGKAMMLGANGASMGRPFLIAANVAKAEGVVNYVEAMKEELQMLSATQKVMSVEKLIGRKQNLYPLDAQAAHMFGLERSFK
ncbi:MAG: alpha-hydroxy-acid oxidizing protein [Candidatus Aenigmatarchaeota archaeon]